MEEGTLSLHQFVSYSSSTFLANTQLCSMKVNLKADLLSNSGLVVCSVTTVF